MGQFKQEKDYSPIQESISNLLNDTKFCELANDAKTSDTLYPVMQNVLQHPSVSNNNTAKKVPNISITVTEQVTTKRGILLVKFLYFSHIFSSIEHVAFD